VCGGIELSRLEETWLADGYGLARWRSLTMYVVVCFRVCTVPRRCYPCKDRLMVVAPTVH